MATTNSESTTTSTRLDKWLWAARFYKTRQLAANAVKLGKVEVNGGRAKPARIIQIGDVVSIRRGPYRFEVTVAGLSERRGPAQQAQTLYSESDDSITEREQLRNQLRTEAARILYEPKRPQPRTRRTMRRVKRDQR